MSKDETVIVIRSLVPGGVAAWDGRIVPGDRLMFVNDVDLAHASLDEAVQVKILNRFENVISIASLV
jgi:multiple PDZ domain protein